MPGKIAIAFEDVITSNAEIWADFAKYARLEGHLIQVIGEDPRYTLMDGLEYNGLLFEIHFDEAISIVDYLTNAGERIIYNQFREKWRCENPKTWQDSKARICFENDISLMFEENHMYTSAFAGIATRLFMVNLDEEIEHIKRLTNKIKAINGWFEDYENEFTAYGP